MCICGILLAVSIWLFPLERIGQLLIRDFGVLIAIGSAFSFVILNFFRKRVLALNTFIAIMCLGIAIVILNTGGLESPGVILLVIIPTLATISIDVVAGILWATIVAIFFSTLYFSSSIGIDIHNVMQSKNRETGIYLSSIIAIILAMFPVSYYEVNRRAQGRRAKEEHELALFHASHDSLTGLFNRRYLINIMQHQISNSPRESFSVLYLDLDKFKTINDNYGHHAGDLLLVEIGQRLQNIFRGEDCCCRIGGDEFCIFLKVHNGSELDMYLKRISECFSDDVTIEGIYHSVSVSVGYATYPSHGKNYEQLLNAADKKMYAIKSTHESNSR
jgi:diguanylate cyclase (GGDEF)-like protein